MIALCFLGDKDILGGNGVRAVAHPAPQRQSECSQAAELAFGSPDRGLDEFFGNWAPIRKHDAIHPRFLEAQSSPRNSTILKRRRCLGGVWISFYFVSARSMTPRRCSSRHILEHPPQRALDHRHVVGGNPGTRGHLKPLGERNDALDQAPALSGK